MLLACLLAASVSTSTPSTTPDLPPGLKLPSSLCIKDEGRAYYHFDEEGFDVRGEGLAAPVRVKVEGRTWRFSVGACQGRQGISGLIQAMYQGLEQSGWQWKWQERGVARQEVDGRECWLKVQPSTSSELGVVLIERGQVRPLKMNAPGATPELPKNEENFPYLTPWPGSRFLDCKVRRGPVPAVLADGQQRMIGVYFVDKYYALSERISAHEFLGAYRKSLEDSGWEIEGAFKGDRIYLQAIYLKQGRDIRATVTLLEGAMSISVTDVGAQKDAPNPAKK